MAYAIMVEIPGGTLEQYDRVGEAMGWKGVEEASEGLIVHFAGLSGETLIVTDVWESREAYLAHLVQVGDKGRDAVRDVGLPPYTHREFEVHNIVK